MESTEINVMMFGNKAQSKHELYQLLTVEANLYLPPEKETSIYFIEEIFQQSKQVWPWLTSKIILALFNSEVKVKSASFIEGLRVKNLLWFL